MPRWGTVAVNNQPLLWPYSSATVFGSTWRHSKWRMNEEEAQLARALTPKPTPEHGLILPADAGTLALTWHWLKGHRLQLRRAGHPPQPPPSHQNYRVAEERSPAKN